MTVAFRVLLVLGSAWAFYYVLKNIRDQKLQINDSLFWFFFANLLLLLALFPGITFFFARILNIESPANLLFLVMLAILIYCSFQQSIRISQLDNKIKELTQNMTIYEEMGDKRASSKKITDSEEK